MTAQHIQLGAPDLPGGISTAVDERTGKPAVDPGSGARGAASLPATRGGAL